MRLIPAVRATQRDGDRRTVPLLPLLPQSAASERLYPWQEDTAGRGW